MSNRLVFISSFLLLIASISLVFFLHNDRNQNTQKIYQFNQNINQLIVLSQSLDTHLLELLYFRLNHYDEFTRLVKQLRLEEQKLTTLKYDELKADKLEDNIEHYLAQSKHKLNALEQLKAYFSSYKNTLRYIPSLVDALTAKLNIEQALVINDLESLLLNFSIFPEQDTQIKLKQKIAEVNRLALKGENVLLRDNLTHHVEANIGFRRNIQNLYDQYAKIKSEQQLSKIKQTLEDYIESNANQSFLINNIFLISISVLIISLLFGLHYFRLAKARASKSRDLLNDAIESISESFAIYDADDKLLIWNSKFEQLYPKLKGFIKRGLSYQEIVEEGVKREQFNCDNLSAEETQQLLLSSHKNALQNILECTSEEHYYLSNNNRISSGGIASVHIDITGRRKMESKLIELSRVVEQSPAAVIITNTQGQITYVNPRFELVTGYSSDDVIGQNPSILKSGYTDDTDYRKMWETINAGGVWTGIFHNKKKNGELFWEQAIISAIRDDHQNITAYLAIKEDITSRKAKEEQLRMAATVFETTSEAIVVTDADNRIKMINPAFEKITGYHITEALGQTPSLLKSGQHDDGFYQNLWQDLYKQGYWQGEIWNRRKNGQIYPQWLSIALVRDDKEQVVEHVAVFSDLSERKKAEEKIRWQANFDQLTKLPNRELFNDRLKQSIAIAKREKKSFAVFFLEFDRFKVINDTFGHAAGDQLLKLAVERLEKSLSESDTIARFGSYEFTIILSRDHDIHSAAIVAERLISNLSKSYILNYTEVMISCNIGISIYPDDAKTESQLIQNADMAMYHAKQIGRDNYHFYTQSMNQQMLARLQIEKDLVRAIEENELFLEYQPVYDPQNGKVIGAEALIRWQHPQQGRLAPIHFISIAEETGLIGQLGEWALKHAIAELANWHQQGHDQLYVAVNVSSAQRELGLSANKIQTFLDAHQLSAQYLTLEITESLILEQTEEALTWLKSLKKFGLKLSIDDFGTGFSSLSYLRRFPMDTLKIDKSFIDEVLSVKESATLVDSIIALAHNFDLKVVAEGVEESAQLVFLEQLNCDYIQGYFYSKPLASEDFIAYVEKCQAIESSTSDS